MARYIWQPRRSLYAVPFAADEAQQLAAGHLHGLLDAPADRGPQGAQEQHALAHERDRQAEIDADDDRQHEFPSALSSTCHDLLRLSRWTA